MRFNVRFDHTDQRLDVKFKETNDFISVTFKDIQQITNAERYDGDYEVVPSVGPQTLATKEKIMTDNLTIKAIPVFDVSNASGGTTFYIATMETDAMAQ